MSKITCECGSSILASSVSRHQKTQKHREFENRSRRAQNQSPRAQNQSPRVHQSSDRVSRAQEKEDRRVEQRSLPKHLIEMVLTHSDEKTCMICYDDLDTSNAFLTRCGHLLCKGCEKTMFKKKDTLCPCCRSEF
jgi:hypothetical protein